MPGLMGRASLIVKAKFSKLLDRSENPNETLDYSYEEQLRQLQNVKRGIADVTTAKKRLELQYTTMQQQVTKLDGQARDALKANREDLAREALTRKAAVQGQRPHPALKRGCDPGRSFERADHAADVIRTGDKDEDGVGGLRFLSSPA